MKSLQTYFQENRQKFDTIEPPVGHFERFKAKLNNQKPLHKVNIWMVASAAAVTGIILTASVSLLLNFNGLTSSISSGILSASVTPEIIQIDEYYQHQVNEKQQLINKMMTGDLSPLEKEVSQTLDELNEGYKSMLNELSMNPRPERSAFVLTQYYQTQLDVLEGIISRMQSFNSLNQKL
jgi:hypothetical protein